ncbi:MAG TPA: choice-of-anchor B family protein [Vicinamibacteria bacterium]
MTRQTRSLAAALLLGLSACGGASTSPSAGPASNPTPTPTPGASSLNMTLRAQVNLAALGVTAGSGNWGYTSPAGRRYALTGTSSGLTVVDVSNPGSPRITGSIVGGSSAWREVRTFRQYAYVTTEAQTGLDIVDLGNPDAPVKVRTWNETFASAHSLTIDESRGLLFAHGTQSGMHVLDLAADPTNPREVGRFTDYYVHDAYARGDRLYAAAIRDGILGILDTARPEAIREIGRFTTGGAFTHNAWLTRDGRYLFTTDERPGAPLEAWSLLATPPAKVAQYIAAAGTIPHNAMIDGDRLVLSHYTEGVHMLDVRDPERPRVMGYYDTYPGASTGFAGAWGAYIFPASNLIVVSDINGGLFVVEYTGS